MDEDKIFGPFTLRQFYYIAGGTGLFYLSVAVLDEKFHLGVGLLIAIGVFLIVMNSPQITIDEDYIKRKKYSSRPEEFKKWLSGKITMTESQISIRKEEWEESPVLEKELLMYKKAFAEADSDIVK